MKYQREYDRTGYQSEQIHLPGHRTIPTRFESRTPPRRVQHAPLLICGKIGRVSSVLLEPLVDGTKEDVLSMSTFLRAVREARPDVESRREM